LLDLVIRDSARRARPRLVEQAFQPFGQKAPPPFADHSRPDSHFQHHRFVVETGSAARSAPATPAAAPQCHAVRNAPTPRSSLLNTSSTFDRPVRMNNRTTISHYSFIAFL
jgi:hypothetical protein